MKQPKSIIACSSCSATMQAEPFKWKIHGKPHCEPCAFAKSTARTRSLSFAISFFGVGLATIVGFWVKLSQAPKSEDSPLIYLIIGALIFLGVSLWFFIKVGDSTNEEIEPVGLKTEEELPPPPEQPDQPTSADPYRVPAKIALRRMAMRVIPYASGFATSVVLLSSFVLTALLLPLSLHLPKWVEIEVVLFSWWALLAVTLATLLYLGWRLKDDLAYAAPWNKPSRPSSGGSGIGDLGGLGDIGSLAEAGEGCAAIFVMLLIGILLLGAAWLVSELVLPLVLFLAHWLTMKALGSVANDRHHCEGSLLRALGYGFGWGLVYVAPLALFVLVFFRR